MSSLFPPTTPKAGMVFIRMLRNYAPHGSQLPELLAGRSYEVPAWKAECLISLDYAIITGVR